MQLASFVVPLFLSIGCEGIGYGGLVLFIQIKTGFNHANGESLGTETAALWFRELTFRRWMGRGNVKGHRVWDASGFNRVVTVATGIDSSHYRDIPVSCVVVINVSWCTSAVVRTQCCQKGPHILLNVWHDL